MRRLASIVIAVGMFSLVAAACGSDPTDPQSPGAGSSGMPGMSPGGGGMGTGMAGTAAEIDTSVKVSQVDPTMFDPESIEVMAGETVEFVITNDGAVDHEFVLGDEAFQAAHEAEMVEMDGMMPADEEYAVTVSPGETKRVIWMFTQPGSVLYGCHVAGHYAAGMVGEITVTG